MNTTKFDPNKHKLKQERLPEKTLTVMTMLCCKRCCEIIQWKVDYGKYVPLEVARKCNLCGEKNVTLAYHRICRDCAIKTTSCAKCQKCVETLRFYDSSKGGGSDQEDDTQERSQTNKENRWGFLEEEIELDELKHLQGLDVRILQQELENARRQEREDEIKALSERKRRAVLRSQAEDDRSDNDKSESDDDVQL